METYRIKIFDILPHDDYTGFLIYLSTFGEGGNLPGAPYVYRIFSVVLAVPFYFLLPVFKFTKIEFPFQNKMGTFNTLKELEPHLRSSEALAFLSFLSLIITCIFVFKITRRLASRGNELSAAILAYLVSYSLFHFTGYYMIDPVAIMFIAILIFQENNHRCFALLILISTLVNEKIILIYFLRYFFISIFEKKIGFNFLLSGASILLFVIIRIFFPAAGNENQISPSSYFGGFLETWNFTASLKGFYLNIFPLFILIFMYIFPRFITPGKELKNNSYLLQTTLSMLVFLLITMLVNVKLSVGRLVMYYFPFFVPYFSVSFSHFLKTYDQKKTIY